MYIFYFYFYLWVAPYLKCVNAFIYLKKTPKEQKIYLNCVLIIKTYARVRELRCLSCAIILCIHHDFQLEISLSFSLITIP